MTRPPLVVIPQHFGSLVFDRRSSRYLPFDQETTGILLALKARSVDQVAAEHGDYQAVFDFYEASLARGFFDVYGRLAADVLPVRREELPESHLLGPLATHLEVIAACNLSCSHCFAGDLPRNQSPLSLREMSGLFGELASMGSFRLGLTGGEPLMRKDILEILDEATNAGLHPCITTNGFYLDEHLARELGKRELVWLNVSLDGASPDTNDAVRGDGVFETVMERLKLLRRHARFTLAFTITSQNHHEVEDCARLAAEVGAHTAVFRPLYPTGTAVKNPGLMPSFAEYNDALRRLEALALPVEHAVCGIDPFSPQKRAREQARVHSNEACGAGTLVCSISVQGDVNPCSFLGPAHNGGNIRQRSFRELWNESQAFKRMRNPRMTGPAASGHGKDEAREHGCGDCGGFDGGCRSRAQAAHGSAFAADPWHDEWLAKGGLGPLANVERGPT